MASPKLTVAHLAAEEFDAIVATTCGRWSPSSIKSMRHLLVDHMEVATAAVKASMSIHQTNIMATRFAAKVRAYRLLQFKKKVPPQSLIEYRQDIETLLRDGYTPAQIVLFLSDNGCETTVAKLNDFIKEIPK
jgi:hypothetical protein